MIQRIQSLWLFLAAMVYAALFLFPVYEYVIPVGVGGGITHLLGARQHYLLLLVAALATLSSLVAIFFYMNRKRQKNLVWMSLLFGAVFIAVMMMTISNIRNASPAPSIDSYSIPGAIFPFLGILFNILALRGIKKDEKLVRSMDRLR